MKKLRHTVSVPVPDVLHKDILSFLPVKTLMRFRCVSKPWSSLINDRDFSKSHVQRYINGGINTTNEFTLLIPSSLGLYCMDSNSLGNIVKLKPPLQTSPVDTINIIGSCSGLVCLITSYNFDMVIWNMSTNDYHKVRYHDNYVSQCPITFFGFGYDHESDDYKVVRILDFLPTYPHQTFDVQVYSLRSNTWKEIGSFQMVRFFMDMVENPVFVSGALHWSAYSKAESGLHSILAFNLVAENFVEVPRPAFLVSSQHCITFGVLEGCLSIRVSQLCCPNPTEVEIWVMKDYMVVESWTKLFSIGVRAPNFVDIPMAPLAYSNCGDKLLFHEYDRLYWYDKRKKIYERVGDQTFIQPEMSLRSLVSVSAYRESN